VILAKAPVRPSEEPLEKPQLTAFSGRCAPLLEAAVFNAIRLSNGAIYQRDGEHVTVWASANTPFQKPDIRASDLPRIANAEFLNAAYIQARRSKAGLTRHYVGVWKRPSDWLLAEFIIPANQDADATVRPLLTSKYPLRSVSFFPSLDTSSGGLTIVQAPPFGTPRIIGFNWWHGSLP
jgi:hypothetical protein